MGLQLDEAEHDLRAGALEVARPADVGFLVEARLQLDQRRDRLAGLGRFDQRADDRTVGRGAIERLLDRHDVGIARRLNEKLHHHVEGFVRMVDDEVLLADRGEAVAAIVAHALGEARIDRRKLQLRPVDADDLAELFEREQAVDQDDAGGDDVDVAGDECAQPLRHARVDLEADDRTAPPPFQRALEQAHQVFSLFLHFDVAVANDAEAAVAGDLVAGEKLADEGEDDLFEQDEAQRPGAARVRQLDEAVDAAGKAHQRVHRPVVGVALELERKGEAEVGNERERVRRVDRQRRQHREDVEEEIVLQPLAVASRERGDVADDDPRLFELCAQRAPAFLLRGDELGDPRADALELLDGREAVVGDFRHPGEHLPNQAGDADHEEFVEIVGRNRQEAQPLEQRMTAVVRFLQHPAVEFQPRQLAVDEPLGRFEQSRRRVFGGGRCGLHPLRPPDARPGGPPGPTGSARGARPILRVIL